MISRKKYQLIQMLKDRQYGGTYKMSVPDLYVGAGGADGGEAAVVGVSFTV